MSSQTLRAVPQRQTYGAGISRQQNPLPVASPSLHQGRRRRFVCASSKPRGRIMHRMRASRQPELAEEEGVSDLEGASPGAASASARGWSEHAPNGGFGRPVLGRSNGARFPRAVKALQEALLARGFPCRDEAGVFGFRTEVALKGLQADEGLPLTGLLDDATMAALMARGSKKADGEQQRRRRQEGDEGEDLYRLRCFWKDEGLSNSRHIRQLVQAVRAAEWPHGPARDEEMLLVQLQRLRRLLPGADVLAVAVREPGVLDADMAEATRNLLLLLEALPGQDVQGAVGAFPSVLLMEDLGARLSTTLGRLHEWTATSSSGSLSSSPTAPPMPFAPSPLPPSPLGAEDGCSSGAPAVHRLLVDSLGLLRRVPDRHAEASLSDLPIDLQRTIAAVCQGAAVSEQHQQHITSHGFDDLGWPM